MNLPPLNLSLSSSAKAGEISSPFMADSSGMSVNFGNGVSQGGSLPSINPVTLGLIVLGVVLWKKFS